MLGLLGRKLGQTRVYDAEGRLVPVTVVLAGPNRVLQCKSKVTDGYDAVQLGFGDRKLRRLTKPMIGHLAKYGALPADKEGRSSGGGEGEGGKKRAGKQSGAGDGGKPGVISGVARIREFRDFPVKVKPGDLIGPGSPGMFAAGDYVDAIGITKGRGFEGVVKRHGFRGGDLSHGSKGWHRRPGAIGQRLFPGTVRRGLRMPGHMGQVRRTVQNLEVIKVLPEDHILLVKGAIPGAKGDYVIIREAKKMPKSAVQAMRARKAKEAEEKSKGKGGAKSGK